MTQKYMRPRFNTQTILDTPWMLAFSELGGVGAVTDTNVYDMGMSFRESLINCRSDEEGA